MAQQVSVELVDDLDGGPGAETVHFALDGFAYEIDLSAAHAAQLREAVAEFVAAARRGARGRGAVRVRRGRRGRPPRVGPPAAAATDRALMTEMREWARANGFPVSDRGRISREVHDAFRATPAEVRAEQAVTFAAFAERAAQRAGAEQTEHAPAATFSSASTPTSPSPAPVRRRAATKAPAKKAPAKKAPAKRTAATRTAAKKAAAKKAAVKKTAPKRTVAKKAPTRKAPAKRTRRARAVRKQS